MKPKEVKEEGLFGIFSNQNSVFEKPLIKSETITNNLSLSK